ncbi:MAG: hypothetical protein CVU32_02585 [Betaproteobacteria bacterium HGW-Betaproteobacteria-5]|nr:MAG: hypothetical protein CVU32_02585 [Betaproteobacteria bacterium HGW-Betaproteobacteria-5]PKO38576.1 MAG: hypothetical protein CVU33_08165 [Betaproteobacteria bacterium HGW-Betaproteobacteria-6]
MLIRPSIFTDELDRGYFGRLMRMNGVANTADMEWLIEAWAGMSNEPPSKHLNLQHLSSIANVGSCEFIGSHTTIPFYEGISSLRGWELSQRHAFSAIGYTAFSHLDWGFACKQPFLCKSCVESDMHLYGQSYWRRSHQVPGLLWCPEHKSSLSWPDDIHWFNRSPAEAIDVATSYDSETVRDALSNSHIVRYVELAFKLLERKSPFDAESVSNTLRAEATKQRFFMWGGRFSINHMLHDAEWRFGRKWLDRVMPLYTNRKKRIDFWCSRYVGTFSVEQRQASFLMECLVASTLLYESVEEALTQLGRYNPSPAREERQTPFLLNKDELLQTYILTRGNYRRIEENYRGRSTRSRIWSGLCELGLPHLVEGRGKSSLRALMAFYLEGLSVADSAEVGGMDQEEMESLLRQCSFLLRNVLKEIDGNRDNAQAEH